MTALVPHHRENSAITVTWPGAEHNGCGRHTFMAGTGYRAGDNRGRITHQGFDRLDLSGGVFRMVERLNWEGAGDFPPAEEVRCLSAEYTFEPGDPLRFRYHVVVANGPREPAERAALAGAAAGTITDEEGNGQS